MPKDDFTRPIELAIEVDKLLAGESHETKWTALCLSMTSVVASRYPHKDQQQMRIIVSDLLNELLRRTDKRMKH